MDICIGNIRTIMKCPLSVYQLGIKTAMDKNMLGDPVIGRYITITRQMYQAFDDSYIVHNPIFTSSNSYRVEFHKGDDCFYLLFDILLKPDSMDNWSLEVIQYDDTVWTDLTGVGFEIADMIKYELDELTAVDNNEADFSTFQIVDIQKLFS